MQGNPLARRRDEQGHRDESSAQSRGVKRGNLHPEQHQIGKRSEEHTSELQSHSDLVCRLLLEKKKKRVNNEGQELQKDEEDLKGHAKCADVHITELKKNCRK